MKEQKLPYLFSMSITDMQLADDGRRTLLD